MNPFTRRLAVSIENLPAATMASGLYGSGALQGLHTERGMRTTRENQLRYLYQQMAVDQRLRQVILDIREMDELDGRVKKVHGRMARTAVKGGLMLKKTTNRRIRRAWDQFVKRLQLHNQEKLESDCRGLVMEGNLPMQWVLDRGGEHVIAAVKMPTETIQPQVTPAGVFKDPAAAFLQVDLTTGQPLTAFALWQLTLCRLSPASWDDMGSMGRPYFDASRTVWRKLTMTEEDLVVRRRTRAPQRLAHALEGADTAELLRYKAETQDDQNEITTNFYSNKKLSVTAVQGDANLDQIADVNYLLDTFYAGAPAPKGLFGYAGELQRDVLEDMKKDYFEEIDALQDTLAGVYQSGFLLELILMGINPDSDEIQVAFAERRTETANQAADRALKLKALGSSHRTAWETAGLDPEEELKRRDDEASSSDPYPRPDQINRGPGNVRVTPGNAPKGESATTIATRS